MILAAITTCKRLPGMVERAMKSVIAQTCTDWNLVVVDDSPADWEHRSEVRKMVESYAENDSRIRYVAHDRNYGAQRARNTALNIANTEGYEFIAYLDDDDEWLPCKLERQLERFRECGEDTGLVYSSYIVADDDTGKQYSKLITRKEGYIFSDLLSWNLVGSFSFTMLRTRALVEAGGFDESFESCQDLDTYLMITRKYKAAFVKAPLTRFHLHQNERISSTIIRVIRGRERIIAKYESSLKEDKRLYYGRILSLSGAYMHYGLCLWIKAVSLQPLRVIRNLRTLVGAFLPYNFTEKLMLKFAMASPNLYKVLKPIKMKLTNRT